MKAYTRYAVVGCIAVLAGLIATCDLLVVGLNYEEATSNINVFLFVGVVVAVFALVTAGIFMFSTTTKTTKGDSARACAGLAVVGCLTPLVMVLLKVLDPGDNPQQSQVDAFYTLIIWSSLLSGARLAIFQWPWLSLGPALAFLFAILGFNLLATGLRAWFDPYRARLFGGR